MECSFPELIRARFGFGQHSKPNALPVSAWAVFLISVWVGSLPALFAQDSERKNSPEEAAPKSGRTYVVQNGSVTYARSEESERKRTPDGEIETQRVRMPSWEGDRSVLLEREVRTKRLPDGTVEKESVLKNPDGAGRLVPTEIIREKIKKTGDSTSVEREVLKPDFDGHWKPLRIETVHETGPDTAKQSVKEVREPTAGGDWRLVERETAAERSSQDKKQSRSVRQLPDAYGRLADYEVREENTTAGSGRETHEVILRRRDFQDTEPNKFFLVERTVSEQGKSPDGKLTLKSTTESDLLAGGATRNVATGKPQVVKERSEERIRDARGTEHTAVNVRERGIAGPQMRPSYQVIQETDREGRVRQLFIPLR